MTAVDLLLAVRSRRRTRLVGADVVEVIPTAIGTDDYSALVADRVIRETLTGIALPAAARRRGRAGPSQVSRRTTSRAAPSPRTPRDAAVPVVVVGHREAVGAGRRDGEQVADARRVEADAVDQDVAALAVAADDGDLLAAVPVEPAGDRGLEPLAVQRHLEVVAHAAVDGDERDRAALDRDDAVEGRRRRTRPCCGRAR